MTAERSEKATQRVVWSSTVSIFAGLGLIVISFLGLRSQALWVVDKLIDFNEDGPALIFNSSRFIFTFLIFVGLLIILVSLVGVLAARTRHKQVVCGTVVLAGALAIMMVTSAIAAFNRRIFLEGVLTRQMSSLCNASTYITQGFQLGCDWADSYDPQEVPACSAICQQRVEILRPLDGCRVLPLLCKSFEYEEIAYSYCVALADKYLSAQYNLHLYNASLGPDACRTACNKDPRCSAIAYAPATEAKPTRCLLIPGLAHQHDQLWGSFSVWPEAEEYLSGSSPPTCERQLDPTAISRFQLHNLRLVIATLSLSFVLLASTCCTCCFMYNVNMLRADRPSGLQLALMMCCTCCSHHLHKRYNEPGGIESEEEEEEETEDSDEAHRE